MGCCIAKCACLDPCCKRLGCGCKTQNGERFADIEKKRSCTDMPCLFLFIAFICGLIGYIWSYAFINGNPNRLINGVDFADQICGESDGVKDLPYAYWPSPSSSFRFKVCTKNCSESTEDGSNIDGGVGYESKLYYDRYCLPTSDSGIKIDGYDTASGWASRGMADVNSSFGVIGISIALACLFAFFYIWLMKKCVGCLVWGTIIAIIFGGILGSLSFLAKAKDLKNAGDDNGAKTQQGIGYFIGILTLIFFLIILFGRNRIRIAIAVIKSASRAIGDMKMIVFFPILPLILLVLVFIAWFFGSVYIFSCATTVDEDTPSGLQGKTYYSGSDSITVTNTFEVKDYNSTIQTLFAPHFFFLLWFMQLLTYFTFTTIAGSVADWYFTERDDKGNKKRGNGVGELSPSPVKSSCKRTCRYHLGTILYAALLIATIQFARWCIRYMERMANGGKKPNKIQKMLFKLVDCLLWCLECCLDKISRNALIFTAIYGDAFCPAVCGSFALVWANLLRVAAISFFSTIVTTLGKIFVPIMTMGLCGLMLLYVSPFDDKVASPVVPLIIIFIISLAIAMLFIVVYDTAIDTVFLCFLIDEKHNKNKGMLADEDLRKIVSSFEKESKEIGESMQRGNATVTNVQPNDEGATI